MRKIKDVLRLKYDGLTHANQPPQKPGLFIWAFFLAFRISQQIH